MNAAASPALSLEGHWASEADGVGQVVLNVEGIRCANCARSIQRAVGDLAGVARVEVNVVNSRASVEWRTAETSLGRILDAIARAGFRPVPLVGEKAAAARTAERRTQLKRIGLAAIGTMQLMMYSGVLWVGALDGIEPKYAQLFRWTCLVIALPVLLYSGAPILRGAVNDLRRRVLGMDVTVGLALVLAFGASAFNTVRGHGEVYFDAVTMFILFLLVGRYFEMRARHQAASVTEALARALPATASRIVAATGATEKVALAALRPGDRIVVGGGQMIPVDGTLSSAETFVDEALVTGESLPRSRTAGDAVLGGSINVGAVATIEVARPSNESTLHSLVRLLERAQSERPRLGLAAERMASWFVVRILALTALVGLAWLWFDPSRAFPAVLAVLVATCPCALSLATPVAIAAATSRLARRGVLVLRANAIEALATVDTVLLDKTGTLTTGAPQVLETFATGGVEPARALGIAAALEAHSKHPVAAAFRAHADATIRATSAREIAGQGIEGEVDGATWRIGRPEFVAELAAAGAATTSPGNLAAAGEPGVALGDRSGVGARFLVSDELRPDARATVQALRNLGLDVRIASGDRAAAVAHVARELGVEHPAAELSPEQKLGILKELQADGRRVLMTGDGINDGPVLAAADVAAAMGNGSSIAHAAGDLLLLRDSLAPLPEAIGTARRALAIVRQNLRWAVGYNLAAVPLAALGFMPPWIAALGMSASSLLVVMNARRVSR
jgi:Cu2+-exporting ATPase